MEIIGVSCVDAMNLTHLNCSLFLAMNNKRENIPYTLIGGEKSSNS
jgi:hypothetical protein